MGLWSKEFRDLWFNHFLLVGPELFGQDYKLNSMGMITQLIFFVYIGYVLFSFLLKLIK